MKISKNILILIVFCNLFSNSFFYLESAEKGASSDRSKQESNNVDALSDLNAEIKKLAESSDSKVIRNILLLFSNDLNASMRNYLIKNRQISSDAQNFLQSTATSIDKDKMLTAEQSFILNGRLDAYLNKRRKSLEKFNELITTKNVDSKLATSPTKSVDYGLASPAQNSDSESNDGSWEELAGAFPIESCLFAETRSPKPDDEL